MRLIIIARILAPHDFGLMGIAMLTIATLQTCSQPGFQAALVQKKENIESDLNAAWTVMIIRGLVLFTILYFAAPHAATFFKVPELKPLIQVAGLSLLLHGFTNIAIIYLQKELEFKKQFIYRLTGTLADFICAVSAALILKTVWALIFGLLAGNIARLVVSYFIHPYKPHISFDFHKAKQLFRFGKWVSASGALIFLITQGDDVFVAKLLGATMLGFYQMAYRITNIPATEITHVISQVTFPAYAKMQDDLLKLKEAFLKVLHVTAFLSFPVAALIFVLARDFTAVCLGEKWMPIAPIIQVLAIAGLLRSIAATAGPVFQALGKPHIETKWQLARLVVLAIFLYPLTVQWGILGCSIAVVLSILVSTIGFSFMAIKITQCTTKEFAKIVAVPLANGVIMASLVFCFRDVTVIGIWKFVLPILGILTYLAATCLSDKFLNNRIQLVIKEGLSGLVS